MKHNDIDAFLLRKWERVFYLFFDRNRSSEVDWGDFYLVTRHVRDIYGAESVQMEYAVEEMKSLWNGLLDAADTNKDGIIQLDEWFQLLKNCVDGKEHQWLLEYQKFMFKLMDVSCDNLLDLAEYTDGLATYGFKTSTAHEAFAKVTEEDNGKPRHGIDFVEFKRLWHEYFYATSKEAPGNSLFGVLTEE